RRRSPTTPVGGKMRGIRDRIARLGDARRCSRRLPRRGTRNLFLAIDAFDRGPAPTPPGGASIARPIDQEASRVPTSWARVFALAAAKGLYRVPFRGGCAEILSERTSARGTQRPARRRGELAVLLGRVAGRRSRSAR